MIVFSRVGWYVYTLDPQKGCKVVTKKLKKIGCEYKSASNNCMSCYSSSLYVRVCHAVIYEILYYNKV